MYLIYEELKEFRKAVKSYPQEGLEELEVQMIDKVKHHKALEMEVQLELERRGEDE